MSTELKRVQAMQRGRQRERAQGRLGGLIDFDHIDQGKVISLPLSLSSLSPFFLIDSTTTANDLYSTLHHPPHIPLDLKLPTTLRQPDWPIIPTTRSLTRYRHHIPLFSTRPHRSHSLTPQQIALPNYILTPLQDETTIDIKNQTTTARPLDIVHYVS